MGTNFARYRRLLHTGAVALVAVVLAGPMMGIAGSPARPAAAQPRPTLTPTPAPTSPPSASPPPQPAPLCESICGQVINLENNDGEPGQTVQFSGSGWSVEAVTDGEGRYAYGRLGTDVGFLDVLLPEGDGLHPVTSGIAVAPVPGQPIVVNLGVYRDHPSLPPLAPSVSAQPRWVRAGQRVTITTRLENTLPGKISGVMITTLLPEGLTLAGVAADRGDVTRSGQYGAVFVGDLWPGEVVTVQLIADATEAAAGSTVRFPVNLIYREHAAAQATASVGVGAAPAVPTSSQAGAAAPTVAPTPSPNPAGTPQTQPATGPALLPVTGYGLTAAGVGAALWALAWGTRRLRNRWKHKRRKEA